MGLRFVGSKADFSSAPLDLVTEMYKNEEQQKVLKLKAQIDANKEADKSSQDMIQKLAEKGITIDQSQFKGLTPTERLNVVVNRASNLFKDQQNQEELSKLQDSAAAAGIDPTKISDGKSEANQLGAGTGMTAEEFANRNMSRTDQSALINQPALPQKQDNTQLNARDKILQAMASQASTKMQQEKAVKDITLANNFRQDFEKNPVSQRFAVINENVNKIDAALQHSLAATDNKSKAASDQVLVIALNKILDPTSVVRESEYARTAEGQSILSSLEGYLQKLKQGGTGLTDENRKDIANVAHKLLGAEGQVYNGLYDQYNSFSNIYGFKPEMIFGNLQRFDSAASDAKITLTPGISNVSAEKRNVYNQLRAEGKNSDEARKLAGF